jgi:hypothetical protein
MTQVLSHSVQAALTKIVNDETNHISVIEKQG